MDFTQYKSIKIQGKKIAYHRKGNGTPMLFIHGITTYSFIWKDVAPQFTDNYDVIVIDLLGCGYSDKPLHEDLSLNRHSEIIFNFCKQLKLNNIIIVSHDVGGGIAQILAAKYPGLLSHLILINSIGYNFWPVQPIIAIRTPIIRQLAMAAIDLGMFELIIKRGVHNKKKVTKELINTFHIPINDSVGRKCFLQFMKCLNNKNLTDIDDELRLVKIPVLIIRGDADVYLSSAIANRLYAQFGNSKLIRIKAGGHYIQVDEPELIVNHIQSFIN